MSRIGRIAIATAFLVGSLYVGGLSLPRPTVACSCMPIVPGQPAFDGQEQAVLVGRVGPADGSGIFPFAVERWFKGGDAPAVRLASATVRQPDGSVMTNSCGVELQPGSHLVLVASINDGLYTPGLCQPLAQVESDQGQALIKEAEVTFGVGGPPTERPPEPPAGETIDLALVAILGVLAVLVVVMFGAIAAFGRRDRPATP